MTAHSMYDSDIHRADSVQSLLTSLHQLVPCVSVFSVQKRAHEMGPGLHCSRSLICPEPSHRVTQPSHLPPSTQHRMH